MRAAHRLDGVRRRFGGRQRIQVRRIAVVPAEVGLVHRLRVVADGAVVVAIREHRAQRGRQLQRLGDLLGSETGVREAQRLVVEEAVGVALLFQVGEHARVAGDGPVVTREHHFGVAEALDRLVDVAAPGARVAHLGAAQRVEVVERVRHDLGAAPGLALGQVEGQLRRRLRVRRVLEDEANAVEHEFLSGVVDDRSVGSRMSMVPRAGALPSPVST